MMPITILNPTPPARAEVIANGIASTIITMAASG
jgi:hypothetical protein